MASSQMACCQLDIWGSLQQPDNTVVTH
jgi:hypothetical protein